jgi:hypothetical protein
MRVSELIEALQHEDPSAEVMIERGEWGPSRADSAKFTVVRDSGTREHNWELADYELEMVDNADDRPRLPVVLIG